MKKRYSFIIKIVFNIILAILFISNKINMLIYKSVPSKSNLFETVYAFGCEPYMSNNYNKYENMKNFYKKLIEKSYQNIEPSKNILILILVIIIIILTLQILKFNKLNKNSSKKNFELKEELKYNQLKNHFMNNMSHEFRTPLNVILSGTQLLQLYSKNENMTLNDLKVACRISDIQQSSLRLLRLINNILDISALDDNSLILKFKNYNVVNVIENLCIYSNEYIKPKNISIIFDTDNEELFALIDYNKFEKIILNLLSNAIKFTPYNMDILVSITHDRNYIYISVSDKGIGISKEDQAFIFDKFGQVDTSLSRRAEGSGLGLFLVKALVNLHGGTISLISNLNMGSTFIICLPINNSKENAIYTIDEVTKSNIINNINIEFSDIYMNVPLKI